MKLQGRFLPLPPARMSALNSVLLPIKLYGDLVIDIATWSSKRVYSFAQPPGTER